MKKLLFAATCTEMRVKLWWSYYITGYQRGLCVILERNIGASAAMWFGDTFRGDAPYPRRAFWLGDTTSRSSYHTRILYLKKFKKLALSTKKYRNWY